MIWGFIPVLEENVQSWLVAPLYFLLDETPVVASPYLHFTSQLLFFTSLYPGFGVMVELPNSAFVLALCASSSLPVVIYAPPYRASLSPA